MLYQTLSHTLKLAPHESPSRRTLNNYAIFYAKPSRKTLNNFGKPSTTLIIQINMKKATSKFFFFQCRLLNYFVHGTIPRYSFFYCSFCLPLHFEISKQFFLLPIISFMKLSNNSFGLLRFSLQSLNLFSYDIWNCII